MERWRPAAAASLPPYISLLKNKAGSANLPTAIHWQLRMPFTFLPIGPPPPAKGAMCGCGPVGGGGGPVMQKDLGRRRKLSKPPASSSSVEPQRRAAKKRTSASYTGCHFRRVILLLLCCGRMIKEYNSRIVR